MLHVRYRARRNHGTLFEPLAARQRTPGIATDVLVMRIGAVGHGAVAGRGRRHGSRRKGSGCRVGSEEVSGILSGVATREPARKRTEQELVNTRTHLYGTLTDYQRHNKTLSWFSRSHSAEWLSSGRSVAASRRANFCPWGAEVNYRDCSSHFLGCGDRAVPAFLF